MKIKFQKTFLLFAVAAVLCFAPAMVMAQGMSIDFRNATGFGIQNAEQFQINDILVEISAPHPLIPGQYIVQTIPADIIWQFDWQKIALVVAGVPSMETCDTPPSLTITVSNLTTQNAPIQGATVTIDEQSGTTDAAGQVSFSNLPVGNIVAQISAPGFTSADRSVELACGDSADIGIGLMPDDDIGALRGDIRLVLTWGTNPSDLDSHLTRYQSGSTTRDFHIYYGHRNNCSGAPCDATEPAWLDVDDVSSFGPETMTIMSPFEPGTYRYSVRHYSGSSTIADSPATVEMWIGQSLYRTFNAPPAVTGLGDNWVWTVVEIEVLPGGQVSVEEVGSYYSTNSPLEVQGVTTNPAGATVKPENPALFENLPVK